MQDQNDGDRNTAQTLVEQIKNSEKLELVNLISKIPVPIAILSLEANFLTLNQDFADLYESDALYLTGKNLGFFSTTVYQQFQDALQTFHQNPSIEQLENDFYSKGHFYSIYFKVLRSNNHQIQSIIVVCADITKYKRRERVLIQNNKRLYDSLYLDQLTGLKNQIAYERFLKDNFSLNNSKSYAFIKLDLDNFKKFNQLNGMSAADAILVKIAHLLGDEIRQDQADIYRLNSPAYIVIIMGSTPWKVMTIAERLRQCLIKAHIQFEADSNEILTCSIGIVHKNDQQQLSSTEVEHKLNFAVAQAKSHGRNSIFVLE